MMKKASIFVKLFFYVLLLLVRCQPQKPIQGEVPDFDEFTVIYQPITTQEGRLRLYDHISGKSSALNMSRRISMPIAFNVDQTIVYGLGDSTSYSYGYPARISIDNNQIAICKEGWVNDWIFPMLEDNNDVVLLSTPSNVYIYDIGACERIEILFDLEENCDKAHCDGGLLGASVTPDKKLLFFGFQHWPTTKNADKIRLYQYDLINKDLVQIGEGIGPSVSHNGELLAYFGYDGLYIMHIHDGTKEKILDFPKTNTVFPPNVVWSSDDSELIFHFEPNGHEPGSFESLQIIIYNMQSKQKTILPVKGFYPSWINQ